MTLLIDPTGRTQFVYDDALQPLLVEGSASVTRASFVEPNADGQWEVDLSPVMDGVKLGPFALRKDAIAAEIAWLENWSFGMAATLV